MFGLLGRYPEVQDMAREEAIKAGAGSEADMSYGAIEVRPSLDIHCIYIHTDMTDPSGLRLVH